MSWPEEIIKLNNSLQNTNLDISENFEVEKKGFLKRFSASSILSLRDKRNANAGLINTGNTCYIGAAIQSLSNVNALSDFIFNLTNNLNLL